MRVDELLPLLKEPQVVAELRLQLKLDAPTDLDRRLADFMDGMAAARERQDAFERRQSAFERQLAVLSADIRETREMVRETAEENRRRDAAYEALRSEVGTFSLSIGQWVADAVTHDLRGFLERTRGLRVEVLERGHLPRLDGRDEEVDATALALGDAGQVRVIAEAKNRVRVREVRDFVQKLARLEAPLPVVAVLVGHWIDDASVREGKAAGVIVVSTLGLRTIG
jgi:hypothetical protein